MYSQKPRWWQLYLVIPLAGGALWLVSSRGWDSTARTAADIIIIGGAFCLMLLWMRVNEGVIARAEYECERRARVKTLWEAQRWRSKSFPRWRRQPLHEQVPLTGFGSARRKPRSCYYQEVLARDRIRIHRYQV